MTSQITSLELIEHLWDGLGRRIGSRQPPPRSLNELRMALEEEWALLPPGLVNSPVNSMKASCKSCIAVRGDHTPY